MRPFTLAIFIALATASCKSDRSTPRDLERQLTSANAFTIRYQHSPLSTWNVRAHVAGSDCDVLYVETSIILEDAMIEAMHYGAGAYENIYPGGVQRFSKEHAFRGVAYKDVSGRVWTYGDIAKTEALTPCH